MTNPTSAEEARIQAALQDYLERRDRGEPIDPEAFLASHADIADALRSFVAADSAVRRAAGSGSQSAANRTQPLASQAPKTPDDTAVSQPRAATSTDLPPTFGRYKIVRTLGRGAMGTVYLAEDTQLQRPVALKTAVFDSDPSGEMLERFYREARSAATLRHPHICPVYDVDQIDGRHFLTMAYIDGRPLSAYVQAGQPMSEKNALTIVRKLALALQEAHDHGIIHRDLKPGNVMIDSKGEPIITDFGLARRVGQSDQARLTQDGMIIGSPAYMSPEQVDGDPDRLTGAADQYSLGVILFELLTGQIPFRGTISSILGSILTKEPPKPGSLRPGLDPRIESLCLRMMAKRPEQRFPNLKAAAAEAATILKSPAAGAGDAPKAAGGPKPAARATDAAAKASSAGATASKAARRTVVEESISEGNVAALAATAKKLVSRRDYDEAIRMLEQIPENRRSDEVRALLDKARRLADEVMFLLTEIDEAVRKNDADTAVRKADDLLKIKPGHHRAKEIREQYGAWGEGGATRGLRRGRHGGGIVGEEGWNLWLALAVGLVAFGVALWGVTAYLKVGDAVVKVTINDPDVTVSLKGHTLSIAGTKEPVKVTPGDGTLKITYGDLDFQSNTFTLKKGENPVVTIERLDDKLAAKFGDESIGEWKVPAKPRAGADTTTAGTTAGATPGQGPAPAAAAAPFDAAGAKALQDAWAKHLGVPVERTNSIGMKFRLIPPGDYVVGATDAEIAADLAKVKGDGVWEQRIRSSGPRHTVRLTKPYYMGVYEVTQKEFETVMGRNPSYLSPTGAGKALVQGRDTGDDPVEYLTWGDAADFCRKLSEREKLSSSYAGAGDALQIVAGEGYRLPTEAEWEAACRAGTTTKYWFGDDEAASDQAAWTTRNAGNLVHKAGQLKANPFGLHDVHGNVWEWCHDFYNPNEYAAFAAQPAVDPTGPSAANPPHRVFRGGGMTFDPSKHHSALRVANAPTAIDHAIGFRVLLPVTAKPAPPAAPASGQGGAAAAGPEWLKWVTALSAKEQADAVYEKVRTLNPEFKTEMSRRIEGDVVVQVGFFGGHNLKDISPLRALTGLKSVGFNHCFELEDIAPLKEMSQLNEVEIFQTRVSDLSALKGKPLTRLQMGYSFVNDLSPLEGMPLEYLDAHASHITSLKPLEKMPLTTLIVYGTKVSDLTPLSGMSLKVLNLYNTPVKDLSTLARMPIELLRVGGTNVSDLSALKEMPLRDLGLDFKPERDTELLRGIRTLEMINGKSVAEFWSEIKPRKP